jgi:hypothetical protein
MSKQVNFKCPNSKCGGQILQEIEDGIQMYNDIITVDDDFSPEDYGPAHYGDGSGAVWYACADCGHMLKDEDGKVITTQDGLAKWLKAHQSKKAKKTRG